MDLEHLDPFGRSHMESHHCLGGAWCGQVQETSREAWFFGAGGDRGRLGIEPLSLIAIIDGFFRYRS